MPETGSASRPLTGSSIIHSPTSFCLSPNAVVALSSLAQLLIAKMAMNSMAKFFICFIFVLFNNHFLTILNHEALGTTTVNLATLQVVVAAVAVAVDGLDGVNASDVAVATDE